MYADASSFHLMRITPNCLLYVCMNTKYLQTGLLRFLMFTPYCHNLKGSNIQDKSLDFQLLSASVEFNFIAAQKGVSNTKPKLIKL